MFRVEDLYPEDRGSVLSRMLVTAYQTAWCLNPENHHLVREDREDECTGSFQSLGTDYPITCHIAEEQSPELHLYRNLKIHILNKYI